MIIRAAPLSSGISPRDGPDRACSMPPCTMCETPVPAGRDVCLACGTHVSQAPTARAGPGQARVALEAALRASAAEEAKGVDVAVAKRLIEASERAHGEGREGRAPDPGTGRGHDRTP